MVASPLLNAAIARRSSGAAAVYPLGEDQRQAVEQQVAWKCSFGRSRGLGRSTRDVAERAAFAGQVTGEERRTPRIEIRVASEAYVERLELLRREQQQERSVATATLRKHDLSPKQINVGEPELVERPGRGDVEEPTSHLERARAQVGLGRFDRPASSVRRVSRERDCTLQERSSGGLAASRLGSVGRELELVRHRLVGPYGRRSQMPCATIRIDISICDLGQCQMGGSALGSAR